MPKIQYINKNFRAEALKVIQQADEICRAYAAQGFTLTLRQLYYQFVSRGLIPNKDKEYNRLGIIINDARLAGLIDWNYVEDRTRNVRANSHWSTPADIIQSAAAGYQIDKWAQQDNYVEVWIEKDALVGVIEGVCVAEDVPYFSCRGYTSQSEVWRAAQRFARKRRQGKDCYILHLGDHDPSGIDMTRDIYDRLALFMGGVEVNRLALNMDQVDQYGPPPNPAKITDSRAVGYISLHGDESWELDALEPAVITALIRENIEALRDADKWQAAVEQQNNDRESLVMAANHWPQLVDFMDSSEFDPYGDGVGEGEE